MDKVADVSVWSTPGAREKCEVRFRPILAAHEAHVWAIAEQPRAVKNNPLLLYRQLRQHVALLPEMKRELDAAFAEEKPDLVIADFTVPVVGLSAEHLGIEWWTVLPSPCVLETPDGPPAYFGGQTPEGSALKHAALRRATRLFKQLVWLRFQREFRALGLKGLYRPDGSEAVYSPHRILALGAREIEFPRSYPPHLHFVGPVLYTPPREGEAPNFISGMPHVLVSLGTHLNHAKTALAAHIREIARRHSEIVFHFTHGSPMATVGPAVANYREFAYLSYHEHLPRYDLVVHHAGAGVMNYCLHHGVPAVVHPMDFDQFDNAARLVDAGVALAARKIQDLEPAILRALSDGALKQRCKTMRQTVSSYDALATINRMTRSNGVRHNSLIQFRDSICRAE
jgi:UDP:flavonoid glycosyltransferase YjiC (YdhE family)